MLADNILELKPGTCIEAYAQGPIAIAALIFIIAMLFVLPAAMRSGKRFGLALQRRDPGSAFARVWGLCGMEIPMNDSEQARLKRSASGNPALQLHGQIPRIAKPFRRLAEINRRAAFRETWSGRRITISCKLILASLARTAAWFAGLACWQHLAREVNMKIAIIAIATSACITTCVVAQAHTACPAVGRGIKHHVVRGSVSGPRNVWPGMTTGSSIQRAVDSWHTGIEQMDSTPSGE